MSLSIGTKLWRAQVLKVATSRRDQGQLQSRLYQPLDVEEKPDEVPIQEEPKEISQGAAGSSDVAPNEGQTEPTQEDLEEALVKRCWE